MVHPVEVLRILLGALALFFSYFFGRIATRLHVEQRPFGKAITWALRMVVCLLGVLWGRGLDALSIVTLVLAAVSVAAGIYVELRPRPHEEVHLFKD